MEIEIWDQKYISMKLEADLVYITIIGLIVSSFGNVVKCAFQTFMNWAT